MMVRRFARLLLVLVLAVSASGLSRSRSSSRSRSYHSRSSYSHRSSHRSSTRSTHRSSRSHLRSPDRYSGSHRSRRASGVARNSHGRIQRSRSERASFVRSNPCPSTGRRSGACRGYVVDHVRPLECGGADAPSNMQWQTTAAGKAKDRTEGKCR